MWKSVDSSQDNRMVEAAFKRIVNEILTAAVATTSDKSPWICTVYVAFRGNRVWFTSQESTRHVEEMRRTPSVAIAMWKAPAAWGEKLLGLQLAGEASEVVTREEAEVGLEVLHAKFFGTFNTLPDVDAVVGGQKRTSMFVVACDRGSIRDEANMGKGRFPIVWQPE